MTDLSKMTDDELLATYQQLKAQGAGKTRARPAGVVNAESNDLDIIGTSSQMNARLTPYKRDLEAKRLDLGPIRNKVYEVKNWAGMSDPQSREYAKFRSDLEKMRNDSLRLNKGVQTEGDAQRAWKELFSNMNDETLVSERLGQIQSYNDAAIKFHKAKVNQGRQQYGMAPPDYSKLEVAPNIFAGTRAAPAAPARNTARVPVHKLTDDEIRKALGL